jgi:hypothetical protein
VAPPPKDQEAHLRTLCVGDRIRISGGYWDAPWLDGRKFIDGTVAAFLPIVGDTQHLVVELDSEIASDLGRGRVAVLHLRYVGASWSNTGIVHVELCDFLPERTASTNRRKGNWVESHASYARLPS